MPWIDQPTRERLVDQLVRHEGLKLRAYQDTVGVWTIGVGSTRNVEPGLVIDHPEAMRRLDDDLDGAITDAQFYARHVERREPLTQTRRAVLANMAFNLGRSRLGAFVKLERELFFQNFRSAAAQMVDSLWAQQVKWRAFELAGQMMLNRWKPL